MSNPASSRDLHGNAPDDSPVALLIIDAINDFAFEEGREVLAKALPMAARIRQLKSNARRSGIPTVYVNDNFGRWRSDFRTVVAHCGSPRSRGREVTRLLRPDSLDYFVLKPKHSGFFSTTLDLLLEHLRARSLILCGLLTDVCVLFTAQDAYMRGYKVLVPADCVAARTPPESARALAHMRRVLDAETRPSTSLELTAVRRAAARAERGQQSRGAARRRGRAGSVA
jgi:nicotinamidase-related amidase